MATPTPSKVSGGCLCGAVRYEINFKPDHDFKTGVSSLQFPSQPSLPSLLPVFFHHLSILYLIQSLFDAKLTTTNRPPFASAPNAASKPAPSPSTSTPCPSPPSTGSTMHPIRSLPLSLSTRSSPATTGGSARPAAPSWPGKAAARGRRMGRG